MLLEGEYMEELLLQQLEEGQKAIEGLFEELDSETQTSTHLLR